MIRSIFLLLFVTLGFLPLYAQLTVGGAAGANMLDVQTSLLLHSLRTRGPAPVFIEQGVPEVKPFDFATAKPYLAFFCRLELDIEQATRFPVRFRLGEVRTWQQELTKRD